MKKLIILVVCGMLIGVSYAAPKPKKPKRVFPHGCKEVGIEFHGKDLMLKPENIEDPQTLYLFFNQTKNKVKMQYQSKEEALVSPEWRTLIKPRRWAAFAMNQTQMRFACYVVKGRKKRRKRVQVYCSDVLRTCHYPRAKFSLGNRGNYWVAENRSRNRAVRDAIRKGILPRW
jgi:hypothetical protein